MVYLYALTEWQWFEDPKVEPFMWKQLKNAFGADRVVLQKNFEGGIPVDSNVKVFMVMPGRVQDSIELKDFEHPENASYVFGNATDNVVRFMEDGDHAVHITTPKECALFSHSVAGAVLFDRLTKNGNR